MKTLLSYCFRKKTNLLKLTNLVIATTFLGFFLYVFFPPVFQVLALGVF